MEGELEWGTATRQANADTRRDASGMRSVLTNAARDRYGLVLTLLLGNYLLGASSAGGSSFSVVRSVLFLSTLLLAMYTSRIERKTASLVGAILLAGTSISVALVLSQPRAIGPGLLHAWSAMILLIVVVIILARVLTHRVVTVQTILGALSAYVILGLMFAALYAAMSRLGVQPFFADGRQTTQATLQYFSFTTLTTLGYGDFTAATQAGRAIAVLEALIGQVFLVTLVARLVSAFHPPARPSTPE